jgi:hypothetical protein
MFAASPTLKNFLIWFLKKPNTTSWSEDARKLLCLYRIFFNKTKQCEGMLKTKLFEKLIKAMKITIAQMLLAICFMSIGNAHNAEAQSDLNKKIYLQAQGESLSKVLKQIEKQTDIRFVFSSKLIQSNQKVNVTFAGDPLSAVLDNLLQPRQLQYKVVDKVIILKKIEDSRTSILSPLPPNQLKDSEKKLDIVISGTVTDARGVSLPGVSVLVKNTKQGTTTDENGAFSLTVSEANPILVFSFIGYSSKEIAVGAQTAINVVLAEDNLQLDQVVVTSSGSPRKKIESSVAVSTISAKQLTMRPPLNSTDMLKAIPGLSVESSGGDGPGSVRVRGLPGGGYVFMGVLEDGLPVLPTGYSTSPSADQYYKVDLTVQNIEAVRGGNAAILLANTPGALVNIISNTGGDKLAGKLRYSRGLTQNANRFDFNLGGPIAPKVKFNIGGFYRADDGARPPSYRANDGGQLKANLTYQIQPNTYIRFYAKYLNDKTAWLVPSYYGYDGTGQGTATPTFDLLTQTLATRDTKVSLKAPNGNTYDYDFSDGYHLKSLAGGVEFKHVTANEWVIKNNFKYQKTDGQFVGAIVTAATAYKSTVKYFYLDGTQLNNPTGFYTGQSMFGTTTTDKQLSDNLEVKKQFKNNALSFGVGIHSYDIDLFSVGATYNTEITDKPRILLLNAATGNGFSGVNISTYRKGINTIASAWIGDEITLGNLNIDLGLRADRFHIKGDRLQNVTPFTNVTPFDTTNTYATGSLGLNYKLNPQNALFARATRTYSALNIGDYSNFTFNPASVRDRSVFMTELGYKVNTSKFALFSSFIYADLNNIASSMLIPNTTGGFISVATFASSRNLSAEIEAIYSPIQNLNFRLTTTFQDSKYTLFEVTAPANARADLANKPYVWSGNKAERIPDQIIDVSANYAFSIFNAFVSFRHIGKRWSSPSNIYHMGGYNEVSASLDCKITKNIGLRLWGDNLTNSRGLTEGNIRGDQFLLNGNFDKGSLQIGRIILPRSFWAALTLSF